MLAEIMKNPLERVINNFEKLDRTGKVLLATYTEGMVAQKGITNGIRNEMDKSERSIQAGISEGDD